MKGGNTIQPVTGSLLPDGARDLNTDYSDSSLHHAFNSTPLVNPPYMLSTPSGVFPSSRYVWFSEEILAPLSKSGNNGLMIMRNVSSSVTAGHLGMSSDLVTLD